MDRVERAGGGIVTRLAASGADSEPGDAVLDDTVLDDAVPDDVEPDDAVLDDAEPDEGAGDPDTDGTDDAVGEDTTAEPRGGPGSRRATVLAVLAAVCVVAAAGAVWLGVQARGAAPDDVAHVDGARTRQVSEQVGTAVTAVFSYDRGDLARTERAADRMLTGSARREYDATFARLREQAGGSGAVQSTTVRSVGVRSLEGDRAQLLVLADRRVLDEDMRSRGSHVVWIDVVAVHTDGGWRIAEMSPL